MTSFERIQRAPRISRTTVRRNGFSLVELLVVIAILLVLASLVFAVVGEVKRSARRVEKINQMKQIGLAMDLYRGDNANAYPHPGHLPGQSWTDLLTVYSSSEELFTNSEHTDNLGKSSLERTRGFAINRCYQESMYGPPFGETVSVVEVASMTSEENQYSLLSMMDVPCPDKMFSAYLVGYMNWHYVPLGKFLADYDRGGSIYLWSDGHVKWMNYRQVESNSKCNCISTDDNRFFGTKE